MTERQTHVVHPVRSTMIGFLGLSAILVAIALGRFAGLIEITVEQRLFGLVIGTMIIVTGNFLPKMRPLNLGRGDRAKTSAAERLAGWVLLLAGLAYIALFVFAPLNQARHISSIIGICAIVVIAVNWTWLARNVLFGSRQQLAGTTALSRSTVRKQKLAAWLLFAFFYVLAVACVSFLFHDTRWGQQIGAWSIVAFASSYALLYGFLGDKRSCK